MGERSEPTGIGAERRLSLRGGTEPAPTGGAEQGGASRNGGVQLPRPTEAPQVVCSEGPMWASAPTKGEQAASTTRASGAQRSGRERWVEIAAEITPKGASNAGQSLSHGEAVTAPVVPRAWPPSIKFQNGIWTSVTVPKILCSHTLTEF